MDTIEDKDALVAEKKKPEKTGITLGTTPHSVTVFYLEQPIGTLHFDTSTLAWVISAAKRGIRDEMANQVQQAKKAGTPVAGHLTAILKGIQNGTHNPYPSENREKKEKKPAKPLTPDEIVTQAKSKSPAELAELIAKLQAAQAAQAEEE